MKKRVLLVALALALAAGCISQEQPIQTNQTASDSGLQTNQTDSNLDPGYLSCALMSTEYYSPASGDNPREKCYFDLALESENASRCNAIQNSYTNFGEYNIINCAYQIGILKGDPSVCDELITPEIYYGQVNNYSINAHCYMTYAERQNDYRICKRIADLAGRDWCIRYYAEMHLENICDELSVVESRDSCFSYLGIVTNNLSLCDRMEGDYENLSLFNPNYYNYNENPKYYCYHQIAYNTGDASGCERGMQDYDRNLCFVSIILKYKTTGVCNKISNESMKTECLSAVPGIDYQIAVIKNASFICEGSVLPDSYGVGSGDVCSKDSQGNMICTTPGTSDTANCYTLWAWIQNDPSVCNRINVTGLRDDCIHNATVSGGYHPQCEDFSIANNRDSCYYGLAKSEGLLYCDKIEGYYFNFTKPTPGAKPDYTYVNQKGECYASFAVNIGESSTCDRPMESDMRDVCYYIFSQKFGSVFCNKISNSTLKSGCRSVAG